MSNVKTVAKGETLFREGDKISGLILIQSGAAQLFIARPKKNIELALLGAGQVIGEQCLTGGTYTYSAVATTETKYIELPAEAYKQMVESSPQVLKLVVKSLADRMKTANAEIRNFRAERDASPCPEDQVAKVFGSIFHTGNHKGQRPDPKQPQQVVVEWLLYRQYSQRVFGESLKRLEQATNLLVKLKMARYEMGKAPDNPEGPDEIQKVHIFDLGAVEAFFEFFQYHYFKGGKSDLLKSDEFATSLLQNLIKVGEKLTPDRFGVVSIPYSEVVEELKTLMGISLNNDHISRLAAKGLFVKRQANTEGVVRMSFEIKEFQINAKIWRILREIEKWNERGFVDPNEEEDIKQKKKTDGPSCLACQAAVAVDAKFCSECGHKLEKAA